MAEAAGAALRGLLRGRRGHDLQYRPDKYNGRVVADAATQRTGQRFRGRCSRRPCPQLGGGPASAGAPVPADNSSNKKAAQLRGFFRFQITEPSIKCATTTVCRPRRVGTWSVISAFSMRMQPYETKTADRTRTSLVPVNGVSPPRQRHRGRRPVGLRGEPPGRRPGIDGLCAALLRLAVTRPDSDTCRPIRVVPAHCLPARPTPTGIAHRAALFTTD